MNTYIIYHGTGCSDGLTSAAIFNYWINKNDFQHKEKYHFIAGHFQMTIQDLPDLSNSIVYFLDFSFKKDLFKYVLDTASQTFLIDHHKSAYDELEEFIKQPTKYNLYTSFNLNECGSSLTWMYLFPNTPLPLIIKHIKDRDIWIWKEQNSKEYLAYLDLIPLNLKSYTEHYQMVLNLPSADFFLYYQKAIELGTILMKQKANLVQPSIDNIRYYSLLNFCNLFGIPYTDILNHANTDKTTDIDTLICKVEGLGISNCPSVFVNDVSEAVVDNGNSDLLIGYNFSQDGIRFSIRSSKYINSISIAKLINDKAGGHVQSSGAFVNWHDWDNIHVEQKTPLYRMLNMYVYMYL